VCSVCDIPHELAFTAARMNIICAGEGEEAIQSATAFTFPVMNRPSSAVYGGVNGVSPLDSGVAGKLFREKRTVKKDFDEE